jgi:peptidoglycan/xylan/chitin deacetylase (PgdA/CDA1 family)
MSRSLTIVMYHYVRDVQGTRYSALKARSVSEFRNQLRYVTRHYTPVTVEQVIRAARSPEETLPERAILLTFDDGFVDHYETVFPLLAEAGVQGAFFPAAKPITDECVLDVHKLHFVLACIPDPADLVPPIFDAIEAHRTEFGLDEPEAYWRRAAIPNRLHTAEAIFVRKMFQRELPEALRSDLLARLFREVVAASERDFARELYMTADQIRHMARAGMYIGSHGHAHYWMNHLSPGTQEGDIDAGLDFLRALDCLTTPWVMCYPYGGWDAALLDVLRRRDCALGLTIEVAVADLDTYDPLTLPRLDTIDLPVSG